MNSNRRGEDKLVNNTIIVGIGMLFSKGISFIMVPIFSRLTSLDQYGLFELMWTYVVLLIPLVTLSIGEGTFRYLLEAKNEFEKESIVAATFWVSIIGSICASLFIWVIPHIPYKLEFIVLIWTEMFFEEVNYILRGLGEMMVYSVCNIIYAILMAIFSITFLYVFSMEIEGIFWGYSLANVCASVYAVIKLDIKRLEFSKRSQYTRRLLKYSVPLIANNISWWIAGVADRSIVSYYLGVSSNAIYSVANKIPSICAVMFSVFQLSWVQSASEEIEQEDYASYVEKIYIKAMGFFLSFSLVVMTATPLFYSYIFDSRYIKAMDYIPILLLSVVFSAISSYIGGVFIAKEQTKNNGVTTIFGAGVNVVLDIIFIRYFGIWAATVSTLVSYLVIWIIRNWLLRKEIKLKMGNNNILLLILFFCIYWGQRGSGWIINSIVFIVSLMLFMIVNRSLLQFIWFKMKGKK